MKFYLIFLPFLICSCQPENTGSTEKAAKAPAPAKAPDMGFTASRRPMTRGPRNPGDWCMGPFSAPVVVNAEKEQTNRRYCYLEGTGAYLVVVGEGKSTASFFVRRSGLTTAEVCTGDQFPQCASGGANVGLSGGRLAYNDGKKIRFAAELQPEPPGALRLTVALDPQNQSSLLIRHCESCR